MSGLSAGEDAASAVGQGLGEIWRKVSKLGKHGSAPADAEATEAAVALATDPRELEGATADFVDKVQAYAALEAQDSQSDLKCLSEMNHLGAAKYKQIAWTLEGVEAFQRDLGRNRTLNI